MGIATLGVNALLVLQVKKTGRDAEAAVGRERSAEQAAAGAADQLPVISEAIMFLGTGNWREASLRILREAL